jgi:hypothetical protein
MELSKVSNDISIYVLNGSYPIIEGKLFKIEIGDDVELDTLVPAGKKWQISVAIKVEEENL